MTLHINGLTVNYGAMAACSDLTIEVPAGRVTAVVGANGAGKSTLLRACAGLTRITSGSIMLDDTPLHELQPNDRVRAGLGFVPEGRGTIPELTVEENLQLGGLILGKDAANRRMQEMLDLFPAIAERRKRRADVLSGGERQQLAIARALMPSPKALLLDEPSLGLAPLIVTQILDLIATLARETSVRILLVEQNAVKALRIADHAYVLSVGKLVASGPASTIADDSRLLHAYLGVG